MNDSGARLRGRCPGAECLSSDRLTGISRLCVVADRCRHCVTVATTPAPFSSRKSQIVFSCRSLVDIVSNHYGRWIRSKVRKTKVRVYQTLVLSILLYASETWTSLASDMRAIESFHMKCQRRILGIRWHDFVRRLTLRSLYALVSHLCLTGLPEVAMPYSHMWQDCQITFPHTRPCYAKLSYRSGRGRPRTKWTDQLRRDNNNVPIATLWRQAIGRGHSRLTLRSEPTTR